MQIFGGGDKLLQRSDVPKSYWNLLDGTADFNKISNDTVEGEKHSDVKTPTGNMSFHKTKAWNYPTINYAIKKGKIYTFSFSVKFMEKLNGFMVVYENSKFSILRQTDIDMPNEPLNTWIRIFYTIKSTADGEIGFGLSSSTDGDVYVGDYMLNEGVCPLDWNYSLNDLRSMMSANKQALVYEGRWRIPSTDFCRQLERRTMLGSNESRPPPRWYNER